jgi:hypothetical protein
MLAAVEFHPVFARDEDPSAGVQRDAASAEDAHYRAARAVAGKDGQLAEQREFHGDSCKCVLHGEQHFDSGRASADHRDATHLALPRQGAQAPPAREKRLDRAEAKRMFLRPGRFAYLRPDVERKNVVVKTFAPGSDHFPPRGIHTYRGILEKAGARVRGERPQIDAAILGPVMPRDDAGNHPRVESVAIRTEQREADAFGRRVAEALQYGEVAVPSPDD